MAYSTQAQKVLLRIQQSETTEAAAYHAMVNSIKDDASREALVKIADEVASQARALEAYTNSQVNPDERKVKRYARMARLFGFTFAAKLMDRRKIKFVSHSKKLLDEIPEVEKMEADEQRREDELFGLLNEKRLSYVGAMILGMNDAIVEITGTLAGLTLAMQNTRLIALSGLITGVAATLSMAASEYLAERSDGKGDAAKSGLMTGVCRAHSRCVQLLHFRCARRSVWQELRTDVRHFAWCRSTVLRFGIRCSHVSWRRRLI